MSPALFTSTSNDRKACMTASNVFFSPAVGRSRRLSAPLLGALRLDSTNGGCHRLLVPSVTTTCAPSRANAIRSGQADAPPAP